MTLYLDIIFFENLCMNYIILYATGIIRKTIMKQKRLILSSIIGSFYAIVIYLKILNLSSHIVMKFILSISMVWLAFDSKNLKVLAKDILIFYVISFVFGGCSFALIYLLDPSKVEMRNGVLVGSYPIKVTLIAGIIAFFAIQLAFKITKNKLSVEDMICDVKIYYENKDMKIKALIDSGNMLKDPVSGCPVIVVEYEKIISVLSEKMIECINKIQGGDVIEDYNEGVKIRLIPFSSLGKENGMLVGVKMKKVIITFRGKEDIIENIIVGIYNKKFTKDNKYNALIGLDTVDAGSEKNLVT